MWDGSVTLKAPPNLYLNHFWGSLSMTALDVGAIKQLHINFTDKFSIACTWLQQRANGNSESTRLKVWTVEGSSERIQKKSREGERERERERTEGMRKESCKAVENETKKRETGRMN